MVAITMQTLPTHAGNETCATLTIETTRFGAVTVDATRQLTLPDGLLGFEGVTQYCLLDHAPGSPFRWLQAVEQPDLAFVAVNPFDFFPEYDVVVPDADVERLGLAQPDEALILTLVTIADDRVTTNLVGPLVIHRGTRQGRQLVLADPRYSTRHSLVPEETPAE